MKTLKSILLGLTLIIACTVAKADDKPTKTDVLNIFMDASAHGKLEKFESVVANDVEYNIQRGERTLKADRKQMLEFYKSNQNVDQACKCTATTIEDSDLYTIVRVEMKYDTYTRVNVITIKNTGSNWKITKVDTSVANS